MRNKILRLKDVMNANGLSKATIYRRIECGLFPKGISLGCRAVGWNEQEIEAMNDAFMSGKSDEETKKLVNNILNQRKTLKHNWK